MKYSKQLIASSIALSLLIATSPVYAKSRDDDDKENNRGRGNSGRIVQEQKFGATTTAQIRDIKQQITELNKQLAELKRTSKISGRTIHDDDDNDRVKGPDAKKFCERWVKSHRHWKWGEGKRWGWYRFYDENLPEQCKRISGYGSTTVPVVDRKAPVISAINLTNVGTTTVKIDWVTDEGATSKIFVATSSSVGTNGVPTWQDTSTTTQHGVELIGLIPGTTYNFIITNTDVAGNTSSSGQKTFTTLALIDTIPPVISGINTTGVSSTTASISWVTNEIATTKLYYGTSSPLITTTALSAQNPTLVTNHTLTLTGLSASTTYYVVAESKDTLNNTATSSQFSFTTTN